MLLNIHVILLRGKEVGKMLKPKKARSFSELKRYWDVLGIFTSMEGKGERNDDLFSMVAKTTGAILHILYPDREVSYSPVLNEEGGFTDELCEGNANPYNSDFAFDLLYWFDVSPYWNYYQGIYGSDSCFEDGNEDMDSPENLACTDIGFMKDAELFEKGILQKHLQENYEEYEGYGEMAGPGYIIIASYLYPYVNKCVNVASCEEEKEMISYLKDAFNIISGWMYGGDCEEEETDKAGYFLCQGGVWDCDGYGVNSKDVGCGDYFYKILLAGEMVESIMFSLDEKYNFLPEHLKRKELASETNL